MEKRLSGYMFKGTRVGVSILFSYLKDGYSIDVFLADFPSVKRKDVDRVFEFFISKVKLQ